MLAGKELLIKVLQAGRELMMTRKVLEDVAFEMGFEG